MNTRKLRKTLLTLCSALLLVSLSVGMTIAYLTDTETVTNTFTVGNVQIKLDEAKVKPDGTYVTNHENRVTENEYKLLPGHSYIKDPTVTVEAKSEDCFVRVWVVVNDDTNGGITKLEAAFPKAKYTNLWNGSEFLLQNVVTGWSNDVWQFEAPIIGANNTYQFRYVEAGKVNAKGAVPYSETATVLTDLFQTIEIPEDMTNEELAALSGVKITVYAEAVQADGFDNADAAWNEVGILSF